MKPKKPFPYYRTIQYTDDGCTAYQCLACKATWEARYMPTKFCGACGIELKGHHESREHGYREWRENIPQSKPIKTYWTIEAKKTHEYPELSHNWMQVSNFYNGNAKGVLEYLKRYRAQENFMRMKHRLDEIEYGFKSCRFEFRAVLKTGTESPYSCSGSVPYPGTLEEIEREKNYWLEEQKAEHKNKSS